MLIHIGMKYGAADDPKYGYIDFYTNAAHAQVIQATHGQTVQFIQDDSPANFHTASGLGTGGFPSSFNNSSGLNQSGSVIDGGTTWSTGGLQQGQKSQVFTVGPVGVYYFGCAVHYSGKPSQANPSMGDVLVSN